MLIEARGLKYRPNCGWTISLDGQTIKTKNGQEMIFENEETAIKKKYKLYKKTASANSSRRELKVPERISFLAVQTKRSLREVYSAALHSSKF